MMRTLTALVLALALMLPQAVEAKGSSGGRSSGRSYSSGSGRSYSGGASSSRSSSSGSRSSGSSGSASRSSGNSSSSSGSSSRSYGSGSKSTVSRPPTENRSSRSEEDSGSSTRSHSSRSSALVFDSDAARARKEATSQQALQESRSANSDPQPGGTRTYSGGKTSGSQTRTATEGGEGPEVSSGTRTYSSGSQTRSRLGSGNDTRSAGGGNDAGASPSVFTHRGGGSGESAGSGSVGGNTRPASSALSYDEPAARARKEATSQEAFGNYRNTYTRNSSAEAGPSAPRSYSGTHRGERARIPPLDSQTYHSRPQRMERYYAPYYTRPVVVYHDPFNTLFWWWLLDRSLDERAAWAYHHRNEMDSRRYQALMASDADLETRVRNLEVRQTPVNPAYVPPGLDRDLMYSDQAARQSFHTRPTPTGRFAFGLIMIPALLLVGGLLIWLIFFKRWRTASP